MLLIATSPDNLSLSKHRMIYLLQSFDGAVPYTGNTLPDGYEVTMRLHFEKVLNSGVFEVVATVVQKANASGRVEFDVHEIIDSEIQNNFPAPPIPAFDQSDPYVLETYYRYYISYKEDYTGFNGTYTESISKNVLYGGVYEDIDFFAEQSIDNSLVGDYPSGKRVGFDQPEFVSWYNYEQSSKQVLIEAVSINNDGTQTTSIAHGSNTVNVAPGQIIVLPVGPNIIGLSASTLSYTVQAIEKGTDARLSELREYRIDRNYQAYERYLMYLNVFGAPETLRCTGAMTEELAIQRQIAEVLNDTNGIFKYVKQQSSASYEDFYTFRTGYLQIAEIRALRDLLIHNQLWEVTADGFTSLVIQTDSFSYNEKDFLFALEFKTTPASGQSFSGGVSSISWDSTRLGAGNTGVFVRTTGFVQRYPNQQSNELIWTENGGRFPADTLGFVFVTKDGLELDEGNDYVVFKDSGPGESTIELTTLDPNADYKIRVQVIEVVYTTDLQTDESTLITDDDGTIITDDDGNAISGFPN